MYFWYLLEIIEIYSNLIPKIKAYHLSLAISFILSAATFQYVISLSLQAINYNKKIIIKKYIWQKKHF